MCHYQRCFQLLLMVNGQNIIFIHNRYNRCTVYSTLTAYSTEAKDDKQQQVTTTTRPMTITNWAVASHYTCRRSVCISDTNKFKLSLINFILFITQVTYVYSWSIGNFLITGSQASLQYADTVEIGAQKGIKECARQFAYEPWPCPESVFGRNIFSKNSHSLPLNREIAFVQAIISAGITHTVTRHCHMGHSDSCRCLKLYKNPDDDETKSESRWGGCSDDVEFGSKISKLYLDSAETGHDIKALVRHHNNEAGRYAVKETMIRMCKCHGVSGACSTQTCWLRINDFREVGNYLKKAYRKATLIQSNDHNEQSIKKSLAAVARSGLAYTQESPDYCLAANSTGHSGMLGRKCSVIKGKEVSSDERKSCRRLCRRCGLNVKQEKRDVPTSCNCKFQFCCEVICEQCTYQEFTYSCVLRK